MERLRSYLLRFSRASFPEVLYRVRQKVLHTLIKRGIVWPRMTADSTHKVKDLKMPSLELDTEVAAVDTILSGHRCTLNNDISRLNDFHRNTMNMFSKDISIDGPDIRSVWEPARLQHISTLVAWLQVCNDAAENERIKAFIREEVLTWITENPFLLGPHYMCTMECGLRIPVLFFCLKVLDNLAWNEESMISRSLYEHAWWVSKNLSLYSSLGNHTICECIGLIFGGAVFRHTVKGNGWLELGRSLLDEEIHNQILEDGGPAEQSLSYHRLVLDLCWLACDFLEKNRLHDCSNIKARLGLGESFLLSFSDEHGYFPSIGDSDDGYAIAPSVRPRRSIPAANNQGMTIHRKSGCSVVRLAESFMMTFDHGPLGMQPLYNHGHADALSITLGCDGTQMLVDPGTCRYNGEPVWRSYFKGSRAHNTVTIDGFDQAVQLTGFIWDRPYEAFLTDAHEGSGRYSLSAYHTGYERLKGPVRHTRSIEVLEHSILSITDSFTGKGEHGYELNFHVHPEASLEKDGVWWIIRRDGMACTLRLEGGEDFQVVTGQDRPPLGWYSPSYGIRVPCSVLTCRKTGIPSEVIFVTTICTVPHKGVE
jgi:hypothetical protein